MFFFLVLLLLCDFVSSTLPFYARPVMCEAIVVKNGTKREREILFILLNPYNCYISLELEVAVLRARYCLLR